MDNIFLIAGHDTMRHLLFLLPNCTPPAIEQFPHVFSPTQRQHGAVVVCILLGLYAFVGLAIACDDYFVPSLEKISDCKYTNSLFNST